MRSNRPRRGSHVDGHGRNLIGAYYRAGGDIGVPARCDLVLKELEAWYDAHGAQLGDLHRKMERYMEESKRNQDCLLITFMRHSFGNYRRNGTVTGGKANDAEVTYHRAMTFKDLHANEVHCLTRDWFNQHSAPPPERKVQRAVQAVLREDMDHRAVAIYLLGGATRAGMADQGLSNRRSVRDLRTVFDNDTTTDDTRREVMRQLVEEIWPDEYPEKAPTE